MVLVGGGEGAGYLLGMEEQLWKVGAGIWLRCLRCFDMAVEMNCWARRGNVRR